MTPVFLKKNFLCKTLSWDEDLHTQLKETILGVRRKESKTQISWFKRVAVTECFSKFTTASSKETVGRRLRGLTLKSPLQFGWDKRYETVK